MTKYFKSQLDAIINTNTTKSIKTSKFEGFVTRFYNNTTYQKTQVRAQQSHLFMLREVLPSSIQQKTIKNLQSKEPKMSIPILFDKTYLKV